MKKLISSILAITLILTMVLSVPVGATPYNGYPFIYEDFENGYPIEGMGFQPAGLTCGERTVVKDPTGRSGYVYKTTIDTVANTVGMPQFMIYTNDIGIDIGSTTKSSVMLYFANGVPAVNKLSIIHTLKCTNTYENEEDAKTWNGWYECALKPTWSKGNWVKYEADVTWSKNLAFGTSGASQVAAADMGTLDWSTLVMTQFYFRFGDNKNPLFTSDTMDEATTMLTMYFDEFKFEPYHNTIAPEVKYGENLLTFGDFTNGETSGFYMNPDPGANKSIISIQSGNPATDYSGNYINIKSLTDSTYAFNALMWEGGEHANIVMKPNHMYELRFKYRINKLTSSNGSISYDSETDEPTTAGIAYRWKIDSAANLQNTNYYDANGYYGSRNSAAAYKADMLTADGNWHDGTIAWKYDLKTYMIPTYGGATFTGAHFAPYMGTNFWASNIDMDFDDFMLVDCGPIVNGDFETGAGEALRWVNSQGTGATQSRVTYPVYGWVSEGQIAHSDDVRANADSGSTKSALVTLNAGQGLWQFIGLDSTETNRYKLSFWAKGNNLADGETADICFYLDRDAKVDGQTNEVYKVPDYQFYTGANQMVQGGWVLGNAVKEWKLTNEWQYYETYISTNFPVYDDRESLLNKNVITRQPQMKFLVNNGGAGSFYIDDVKLEGAPKAAPEVSDFVVSGYADPGKEISVDYTFTNALGYDDANTLVRVYADGASVGSFKANGGSFEIPEAAIGKVLEFEILPLDAEGNAGALFKTRNVASTCNWTKLYINDGLKSVRAYAGEPVMGKVVFASFNDTKLVDIKVIDANIAEPFKAVTVAANTFVTDGANRVKIMFIDGVNEIKPLTDAEEATIVVEEEK